MPSRLAVVARHDGSCWMRLFDWLARWSRNVCGVVFLNDFLKGCADGGLLALYLGFCSAGLFSLVTLYSAALFCRYILVGVAFLMWPLRFNSFCFGEGLFISFSIRCFASRG